MKKNPGRKERREHIRKARHEAGADKDRAIRLWHLNPLQAHMWEKRLKAKGAQ